MESKIRGSMARCSIGTIAASSVLLSMLFGTSPLPPPYHQYIVEGRLSRVNGGPKQHFVVSLVGRFRDLRPDTTYELQGSLINRASVAALAATDTGGAFTLDVQTEMRVDSLGILVSVVDRAPHLTGMLAVPLSGEEITQEGRGESSGCGGCESTSVTAPIVVGYRYRIPDQFLVIPL
jgi:hypothetical protein